MREYNKHCTVWSNNNWSISGPTSSSPDSTWRRSVLVGFKLEDRVTQLNRTYWLDYYRWWRSRLNRQLLQIKLYKLTPVLVIVMTFIGSVRVEWLVTPITRRGRLTRRINHSIFSLWWYKHYCWWLSIVVVRKFGRASNDRYERNRDRGTVITTDYYSQSNRLSTSMINPMQ